MDSCHKRGLEEEDDEEEGILICLSQITDFLFPKIYSVFWYIGSEMLILCKCVFVLFE